MRAQKYTKVFSIRKKKIKELLLLKKFHFFIGEKTFII